MESNKQERSVTYRTKAIYEQKEKAQRQNFKNSGELACIQEFNEQELIDFINSKYEKIINQNQQMYLPLSQTIHQRIITIRSNTLENAKRQLREFILRGQATITKENEVQLFSEDYLYNFLNPKNRKKVNMIEVRIQNIRFMSVQIRTKTQMEERKLFFCGKMPAECQMEIDFKRFKKDCLHVLEAIVTFKEIVLKNTNQQL